MGEEQCVTPRDAKIGIGPRSYQKPSRQQLARRFTHHAPHGDQAKRYETVRATILATANLIVDLTPCSPEQSLALNALDQAMFLANAAIARGEAEDS